MHDMDQSRAAFTSQMRAVTSGSVVLSWQYLEKLQRYDRQRNSVPTDGGRPHAGDLLGAWPSSLIGDEVHLGWQSGLGPRVIRLRCEALGFP